MISDKSIQYIFRYEEDEINKLPARDIRPRARTRLQWDQVNKKIIFLKLLQILQTVQWFVTGVLMSTIDKNEIWFLCGQIEVGQVVMANYCPDEPKERGFWYDVEITRKSSKQVSRLNNNYYPRNILSIFYASCEQESA